MDCRGSAQVHGYVKLRKERDKFLKSLKPGWYSEWLIHKKLIEAGGLGDTVYILPARGSGTSFRTLKRINELLEEGRDVQPVTLKKYEWPALSEKDAEKIREHIQLDLAQRSLIAEQHWIYQELMKDFSPKDQERNEIWISSIRPDSYVYDWRKFYGPYIREQLLYKNTVLGVWEEN